MGNKKHEVIIINVSGKEASNISQIDALLNDAYAINDALKKAGKIRSDIVSSKIILGMKEPAWMSLQKDNITRSECATSVDGYEIQLMVK